MNAELGLKHLLNGTPRTADQLIEGARSAVLRFPFDPHLRSAFVQVLDIVKRGQ